MHARQPGAYARLPRSTDHDGFASREIGELLSVDLEHVGHDHGDVVGCAASQGEIDEGDDGCRWLRRAQDRAQFVVADHTGEPITAQQEAISRACLDDRQVGISGLESVDRSHDEGAAWVHGCFVFADAASVDERLHIGVVVGDAREVARAQQVAAGVADVDDGDPGCRALVDEGHGGGGGAHAHQVGVVDDDLPDADAGGVHARGERGEGFSRIAVAIDDIGQGRDGSGAGELTGRVPTHAIGDDEQSRAGVSGVLVLAANHADIGARGVAQGEGHGYFRNCMVVRPTRRGVPGVRAVGCVMRVRSIQVPLVDPRSSTIHPPSLG